MSLFGDLRLSVAREVRSRIGARAALRLLRPMITATAPSPLRAAAILLALEYAIEERDEGAFTELAEHWRAEHRGARRVDIETLCRGLLEGQHAPWALELADAEVARADGPASRTLRAAILEALSNIDGAIEDLERALRLATLERDRVAADAARLELIRLLVKRPTSALLAARLAREIETEPTSKWALLTLSIARLYESGRYARVGSIEALTEWMFDSDRAISRAAQNALLSYVDEFGDALTSIELDRVRAAMKQWPDAAERPELEARFARVRTYLAGTGAERNDLLRQEHGRSPELLAAVEGALSMEEPTSKPPICLEMSLGLEAIRELAEGRAEHAKKKLDALGKCTLEGLPSSWTATWMGLDHAATRDVAISVARALLETRSSPPRGFLAFAAHLEHAHAVHLALVAMERAEAHREHGARERRIDAWRRAAWEAHARGDREEAMRCLLRAKA